MDVTADSDIKCHITPVLSDYSPCLRFPVVWNDRMTTSVITLLRVCVTSLTTSMSTMGVHIQLILHSWLFNMIFMKLSEGSFHKFHMK